MFSLGYGEVYPITWQGQLFTSGAMLSGIILIALPTAIIGRKFHECYLDCDIVINDYAPNIFKEYDDDSYFVGRIENLSENKVELKLLNEDAEWIGNEKIKIEEITYIGFRTSYEKELLNKNAGL